MIYLDYQATTPLAPEVKAAMVPWLDHFANPHSPNRQGREAAAAIEHARSQVAAAFPPGGDVIFTSGATEALNLAIKGMAGGLVSIVTEHAAVLDTFIAAAREQNRNIQLAEVDQSGLVVADQLFEYAQDEDVTLVAAMLVNNEIGVIQPVEQLSSLAHEAGALMLCDAVQGFGRMAIPDGPDLIACSAHKIHGPKGIGALWIRHGVHLEPLIHGGGQERALRSGTLSPMLCAGFGAAAALAVARREQDAAHVESLWSTALDALGPGWTINGSSEQRYSGNLNIRREGLDAARLLSELRDIAFSLGSACASGSGRPSHVLRALGLGDSAARSSIRLGFGRYTTEDELADACRQITAAGDKQARWVA